MNSTSRPLLFLTGFLGAGKTTLLRSLLLSLKKEGKRADVILNDFANAELDAATLNDKAASVAPIAASCACCESLDELVALCQTAAAGQGEVLLVELNGTADPLALLEAFTLLEEKLPFFPRLQIGVVDVRHWGRRGEFGALERRQLETAGLWIPSHLDAVASERVEQVDAEVRALAPLACRVTAEALADAIIGELHEVSQAAPPSSGEIGSADLFRPPTFSPDEIHRLSHRFTGITLPLPVRVRRESIESLLLDLPPWVVRAKALVRLAEDPEARWLFQRTGADDLAAPIPVPEIRRASPALVCVGPGLDPGFLRELVSARFGSI